MPSSEYPSWRRYLRFWGANVTADVDEEIAFHLEGLIAEYVAAGMRPDEARKLAVERFGDPNRIAQTMRTLANQRETAMRRTEWLDALARDVRYALRQLGQRPGFTIVALVTLALGIGANTAIFTAVNAVLLHPLPVRALDRVMVVQDNMPKLNLMAYPLDPTETVAIGHLTDVVQASGGALPQNAILAGYGEPRRLNLTRTLDRYFDVFGLTPQLGRFYRPDESEEGKTRVVVLSHDLWQELGGKPDIVGRMIQLNGYPYEVVGVMSKGFRYPRSTHLWAPFPLTEDSRVYRGRLSVTTMARLKPGVAPNAFGARLEAAAEAVHPRSPGDSPFNNYMTFTPFIDFFAGELHGILLVLLGAVGFVLLIACANVACLQLVRGTARTREMAVRTALGAARGTIVRQLLVENLVLSMTGGVLGLLVGAGILRVVSRAGASQLVALQNLRLDATVLAFTAAATIVAGFLFGIAPALRAGRVDVQHALKESARGASLTAGKNRLLRAGVVVQVALTLVLLLGSGLMIRSLVRLLEQDPGFRTASVTTMRVSLAGPNYRCQQGSCPKVTLFWDGLLTRLRALPGVESVGLINDLPFSGNNDSSPFTIRGRARDPNAPELHANLHTAGGNYFKAMGIPLIRGRVFDETDTKSSAPVIVIDEQLAKQFFGSEDPIGKVVSHAGPDATVIGVVGTVSQGKLDDAPKAATYSLYRQRDWYQDMFIVVRSALPASSIVPMVQSAVKSMDPNLPVYEPRALVERINDSLAPRRLTMSVLTGLGAVSLVLAICGLYGVISYGVSQRTTEFGIRVALGAQPGDVRQMVIRQGLVLAAIGVVAGLAVSFVATRALERLLFGVSAHDPLTFVGAPLLLALVALVASYVPARRATRVSPVEALRSS